MEAIVSFRKNDFCSYCGTRFDQEAAFPRTCTGCENVTYINPVPVAVAVVPIGFHGTHVLAVKRAIPPKIGHYALPGGYLNHGETGADAAARELREEAGIMFRPEHFCHFAEFADAQLNLLLSFWITDPLALQDVPTFVPNTEASEIVAVRQGAQLAFPTHTDVLELYFRQYGRK